MSARARRVFEQFRAGTKISSGERDEESKKKIFRSSRRDFRLLRCAPSRFLISDSRRRLDVNLDSQLQQIIDELLSHGISLDLAKKEFEKKYIVGAVKRSSGNLGRAASSLGIHRNTLRNKVGVLNIRFPRDQFRIGVSPEIHKRK
jgi:DNA-binding NtrC family response regulator